MNEYVHDATDDGLLGVVVQVTGGEPDSASTKAIVASFKALKDFAVFANSDEEDEDVNTEEEDKQDDAKEDRALHSGKSLKTAIGLSYTINLNLPATSDIKVFDAIFSSLKQHLLK